MMRSLFAGVSGLRNHQIRMDVIGNNIANVNTVGFKAGRVTFKEVLHQTLQDATSPSETYGGRNPAQVGLGMSIGSVDTLFSQGGLESTEQMTDLAIQGEGFFVVSDGTRSLYTRAGDFHLDADGRLVSPHNGLIVQGKMADATGNILSGTSMGDIVLPFGRKAPALGTTEIEYRSNLNADSDAKIENWTMSSALTTFATVTGTAAPSTLTITAGTNDELKISVDGSTAETITIAAGTYAAVDALITAINTAIAANANLNGEVTAVNVGGKVSFRTTDAGADASITLTEGNALANLNISAGATDEGGLAGTSDSLNTLGLVSGDTIRIAGTNPDGSAVSATYTYADGESVQDLLDAINAAFTGATTSLGEDGKIVLKDDTAGDSLTSISLSASPSNTGTITLPGFSNTVAGRDAGVHSTSIFVYDSLGNKHNIEITFTKSSASNTWDWTVTIDGGLISPTEGDRGQVTFNNDGSLAAFTSSDNAPLRFSPGGGAESMSVTLNGGRSGGFDGITQFASPSTTIASDQNGHGMGVLSSISIDSTGKITGTFTNGVSQTLAQIALATFNNPGGLLKVGDNMYEVSGNSGQAVVGLAGTNVASTIVAGALEMSNVDLAKEFTNMIIAQRGFQANARVITTSDTLLDEITRLKR